LRSVSRRVVKEFLRHSRTPKFIARHSSDTEKTREEDPGGRKALGEGRLWGEKGPALWDGRAIVDGGRDATKQEISLAKRPRGKRLIAPRTTVQSLQRSGSESNGHAKKFLRLNNVRGVGP
jgi:hypothetical protein